MTTSVQTSPNQSNESLMEENLIQAGPTRPPTLENVANSCNFTFTKAAIVSPQYSHCSV